MRHLLVVSFLAAAAPPALPPPVPGFPVGCLVHVKSEEPEQARAAGFKFGEIGLRDVVALSDAEFDQLRNRLRALPLPIRVAINFLPPELLVVGPRVDRKAQDEYLARAL